MSLISFPEPPTQATLADARRDLLQTTSSVLQLDSKITQAEADLARIVHDSKIIISHMQDERACLQQRLTQTMAYLSPIRRLPADILSDIFMHSFEDYSCQAWILASVCSSWRHLTLRMPRIWSKVMFPYPLLVNPNPSSLQLPNALPQRASVSSGLTWLFSYASPMQSLAQRNTFKIGLPGPSLPASSFHLLILHAL